MYLPFYNNPFYYPRGAYINNMCSYNFINEEKTNETNSEQNANVANNTAHHTSNIPFSITEDRLELFGISINIDDLIILITLFFMFKENQIDYGIVIILAIILFDQN